MAGSSEKIEALQYQSLESLMFHMARDLKDGKVTEEQLEKITNALFIALNKDVSTSTRV